MLRRLYDWTMRLAGHRHATPALAAVSFVESSAPAGQRRPGTRLSSTGTPDAGGSPPSPCARDGVLRRLFLPVDALLQRIHWCPPSILNLCRRT